MLLEEYLDELGSLDIPVKSSKLVNLSNLLPGELELVKKVWPGIDEGRCRDIVLRLVELAEDNVELNFDEIFRFCLDDPSWKVREEAISGLWECEDPSLVKPLVRLLEDDEAVKVRVAAASTLGKFMMLAALGKLSSSRSLRAQETLLAVVRNEEEPIEVRRRALESIAPLGIPEVRELIQKAYESKDVKFKASALYAMGKSAESSWLSNLVKELSSDIPELRYEAVRACGGLEDEAAIPHIIPILQDPDLEIRLSAIYALGCIGGSGARQGLNQCLESSDEQIRDAAREALEHLELWQDPLGHEVPF